MWMPLEHRHLVQGGKIYETASHDKEIVTVECPIADNILPAKTAKQGLKRVTWTASFRGIDRSQDWLHFFRPIQNRFRVVKRMKGWMLKIAHGHEQYRLADKRVLHDQNYQILPQKGIHNLC